VVVELEEDACVGRGEGVPYARYGETPDGVVAAIESVRGDLARGADRRDLLGLLPAGAARNAVDCALWDLEARRAGIPAWRLAGLDGAPRAVAASWTVPLGDVGEMAARAGELAHLPILKVKVGAEAVVPKLRAVRAAAPGTRLLVDANEAWTAGLLAELVPVLEELGVETIEQPLPAGDDGELERIHHTVPVCADESFHGPDELETVRRRYDAVNLKLDKTGGLTAALDLRGAVRAAGLRTMVGCMVSTSLAIAPAFLLAGDADLVDLDGPLLLERDRDAGVRLEDGLLHPPAGELWGG